jgi:ParB family chromosome partitioning protein
LIENLLREDLAPVEQARAYQEMMRLNDWGTNQLARGLHIPPSAVSQALSLLELPAPIQQRIDAGELAASVGYELSKLDDPAHQAELAGRVATERLTREETVAEIRRLRASGGNRRSAGGRGRGGTRKITRRIFKHDGIKITLERSRGLDTPATVAALEAVLAQLRADSKSLDAA